MSRKISGYLFAGIVLCGGFIFDVAWRRRPTPKFWIGFDNEKFNTRDKLGTRADGIGNVYITGSTDDTSGFFVEDAFLSKYDAAGQHQWTARTSQLSSLR